MFGNLETAAALLILASVAMWLGLIVARLIGNRTGARRTAGAGLARSALLASLARGDDARVDSAVALFEARSARPMLLDIFTMIGAPERARLAAACAARGVLARPARLCRRADEEGRMALCELADHIGDAPSITLLEICLGDRAWRVALAAGIGLARRDRITPAELLTRLPARALRSARLLLLLRAYPRTQRRALHALADDARQPTVVRKLAATAIEANDAAEALGDSRLPALHFVGPPAPPALLHANERR